jgi:hypothetical protein
MISALALSREPANCLCTINLSILSLPVMVTIHADWLESCQKSLVCRGTIRFQAMLQKICKAPRQPVKLFDQGMTGRDDVQLRLVGSGKLQDLLEGDDIITPAVND